MKEKEIICGIDLGPATGSIVCYAAWFALKCQASVRLFYVIDYLLTPPAYLGSYIEQERQRDEAELLQWKEQLSGRGVETTTTIAMGRLHDSFLKQVQSQPELLILGYQSHLVRASSSEKLVRSLPAPMLVVKGAKACAAVADVPPVRKVLCAVDGSEYSRRAGRAAAEWAARFSAQLVFLHSVPSHVIRDTVLAGSTTGERERFERELHSDAHRILDSFCSEFGGESRLVHGHPGEAVCAFAREHDFDLVAVGARGESALRSMLIGSTTEAVLKGSDSPVLIIH